MEPTLATSPLLSPVEYKQRSLSNLSNSSVVTVFSVDNNFTLIERAQTELTGRVKTYRNMLNHILEQDKGLVGLRRFRTVVLVIGLFAISASIYGFKKAFELDNNSVLGIAIVLGGVGLVTLGYYFLEATSLPKLTSAFRRLVKNNDEMSIIPEAMLNNLYKESFRWNRLEAYIHPILDELNNKELRIGNLIHEYNQNETRWKNTEHPIRDWQDYFESNISKDTPEQEIRLL